MDLKELESGVDPHVHWYYQVKKKPMFAYIRHLIKDKGVDTLIDLGSGSGFFSDILYEEFKNDLQKVWQVDIGYTEEEMAATAGKPVEKCHYIPKSFTNSVVIMMDVLEHLESDLDMLNSIKQNAAGHNNYYYITVPAFMSLWSPHDDYLGHYRRYKVDTLNAVLRKAQFSIGRTYYMYGLIFPLVKLVRLLRKGKEAQSDMKPMGAFANSLLKWANSIELPLRKSNKLAGVTCVGEGRV